MRQVRPTADPLLPCGVGKGASTAADAPPAGDKQYPSLHGTGSHCSKSSASPRPCIRRQWRPPSALPTPTPQDRRDANCRDLVPTRRYARFLLPDNPQHRTKPTSFSLPLATKIGTTYARGSKRQLTTPGESMEPPGLLGWLSSPPAFQPLLRPRRASRTGLHPRCAAPCQHYGRRSSAADRHRFPVVSRVSRITRPSAAASRNSRWIPSCLAVASGSCSKRRRCASYQRCRKFRSVSGVNIILGDEH